MHKDWTTANQTLSKALADYRKAAPQVAKAFSIMAESATAPGALSPKTKELIALAIGIAGRCDGCIGFHTTAAIRLGATRDEAVRLMQEAIELHIKGLKEAGETVPPPSSDSTTVEIRAA